MLQGEVDVGHAVGRQSLENGLREAVGLQVEQTQPDGTQAPQIAQQALRSP